MQSVSRPDGPSRRRLDLSLFKDFVMAGATRLQLQIECDNILDTPSSAKPAAALGEAGFGSVAIIGNSIPRQMQCAVKFLFQG
jgi:hypothetical protein